MDAGPNYASTQAAYWLGAALKRWIAGGDVDGAVRSWKYWQRVADLKEQL